MNLKSFLEPGAKIWIDVLAGNYKGTYPTTVEVVKDDAIVVGYPLLKSALVPLARGTKVRLTFKGKGALYTFESRVIGRGNDGPLFLYLEIPEKVERIQRRRFVRLEVVMPFYYKREDENYRKGVIKDISGSGLRGVVSNDIKVGDTLTLFIDLSGMSKPTRVVDVKKIVTTKANVVREIISERLKSAKTKEVGMDFIEISETDRQKIVRFIFEKERLSRQKGLL